MASRLQFNRLELREISREGRRIQMVCTLHGDLQLSAQLIWSSGWRSGDQTLIQQPLPPEQFERDRQVPDPDPSPGEAIGFWGVTRRRLVLALVITPTGIPGSYQLFSDETETVLRDSSAIRRD